MSTTHLSDVLQEIDDHASAVIESRQVSPRALYDLQHSLQQIFAAAGRMRSEKPPVEQHGSSIDSFVGHVDRKVDRASLYPVADINDTARKHVASALRLLDGVIDEDGGLNAEHPLASLLADYPHIIQRDKIQSSPVVAVFKLVGRVKVALDEWKQAARDILPNTAAYIDDVTRQTGSFLGAVEYQLHKTPPTPRKLLQGSQPAFNR